MGTPSGGKGMTRLYVNDLADLKNAYSYRTVELLGIGEFADRVGLKKSTIYVYHSTNKLPEPDLVVNGGNTALWFDSTVDRWKEER